MNPEEPTVLDYLKSLLTFWKGKPLEIPPLITPEKASIPADDEQESIPAVAEATATIQKTTETPLTSAPTAVVELATPRKLPWRLLAALLLALVAQTSLEPRPTRTWLGGMVLYILAAAFLIWSTWCNEWAPAPLPEDAQQPGDFRVRARDLYLWLPLTLVAFLLLGLKFRVVLNFWGFSVRLYNWEFGVLLYLIVVTWLIWSALRGEWAHKPLSTGARQAEDHRVRARWLYLCLPLALLAFLSLGGNRFTSLNVILWLLAIVTCMLAFWQGPLPFRGWATWLRENLRLPWRFSASSWTLLVFVVAGLVVLFRLNQLNQVPPEMVSDHAEKLLDVWDVLNGQPSIFFPRNTGREALQMYLTAGIIRLFDTGFSFLSLKIGTVLAGLCTLPYIYLLGQELGNRWVGLFAALFAGIAYWPNVISRAGLRFPLYPLFVALVLFYMIRGLRTSSRNDFILAGLALGIGLHGYTPIRIVPLLILVALGLYLLHSQARGKRNTAITRLMVLVLVSLMVFLPLLRYAIENPEMFGFRALSRLGTVERPLPDSWVAILGGNLWNALAMFGWSDGNIWVHSVTGRPALDIASAALYYLGGVMLFIRYLHRRRWQDLLILLSIPLLMLPSILSLAFPDENPALNRAAGAMVPVFIVIGFALESLLSAIRRSFGGKSGQAFAWGASLLLVGMSSLQNYDLLFNQYQRAYELSSWNTSEMGRAVRDFGELYGGTETAWVVAYPHWVDTRLVGMIAGDTLRDYAIWPDALENTVTDPRAKLFLINPADQEAVDLLIRLYPLGSLTTYDSEVEKDFLMYVVPPSSGLSETTP